MAQLKTLCLRLIPALLAFAAVLVLTSHYTQAVIGWFNTLPWLTIVAIAFSALIAAQFGRSRLVWTAGQLIVLLWLTRSHPHLTPVFLMISIPVVSWLLWRPDRGWHPMNAGFTLFEIAALGLLSYSLLPIAESSSQAYLSGIYSWLHALGPEISRLLSPFQWSLYTLLVGIALVRLWLLPSNNQVALFVALITMMVLSGLNQTLYTQVLVCFVAVLFVIATLVDSFNMAFRDELTTIPSRRALVQFVQTLGRKYVVVMADIDHFKKFNDTHGHEVGDQVLKLVASKLSKVTGGGKAFRYGGEEFTLIFPRKSIPEVMAHVEALRHIIADYEIFLRGQDRPAKPPAKNNQKTPTKNKTVKVTCSFGVAQKTSAKEDFAMVMKQADVALYSAKKAGRNCVKAAKA